MFVILITILLTIVSMYFARCIAQSRGRSSKIWLWIAGLLDHSRFYWYFFSRICKDRMATHPTGPKGGRRSIPLQISCCSRLFLILSKRMASSKSTIFRLCMTNVRTSSSSVNSKGAWFGARPIGGFWEGT